MIAGFRSPRQILLLFLGTTLVLFVGLGWFGVRTFERDRAVAVQGVRDRLESSADLIAAEIRQTLTEMEQQLTRLSLLPADEVQSAAKEYATGLARDTVVVIFTTDAASAYPEGRLLYYPALSPAPQPSNQPFVAGEMLEFRSRDFQAASAYFSDLARAYEGTDAGIRAGALVRLARNQRKAGRLDAAIQTYQQLADLGSVRVNDWPAEVIALSAGCEILDQLGRTDDLAREARKFGAGLQARRWRLTRSSYIHFTEQVAGWLTDDPSQEQATPIDLALATSVDGLWESWQQDRRSENMAAGRSSTLAEGQPLFSVWRGTANQFVALIGGPQFLQDQVFDPLQVILGRQGVSLVLTDAEGEPLLPETSLTPSESVSVLRTIADTRLPWMLRVVSADMESDLSQVSRRGRLLFAGLAFLALLTAGGAYFSARAMSREIEVARLQSDFVAAVSHEFRTPLTTLRQFTDLLSDGRSVTDTDRASYYAALRRGTRRLNHLVENLLDFGRIEAGFQGFVHEPLLAEAWAARVVAEFRQELEDSGYEVIFDWSAPADVMIQADEEALGRALWNLLDNAVKYSPDCRTIRVRGEAAGNDLLISVQDRGLGIPKEEHSKIFAKFVRGSARIGNSVKGTGLGLSLVDEIVRAHRGRVTLDSKLGEGSTFTIMLPILE
jgi:signal transduction histidine kinase